MTHPFGPASTTDEVLSGIDLAGRRVFVTGASAGLGVETCRALAAHGAAVVGAAVVGAARDLDKAQRATEPLRAAAQNGFEVVQLDLASLASVRQCAGALVAAAKPFDLVIANAGVMACPKGATADGFETQFGTNHLGHFALINRLVSLLRPGARVVVLSSAGHRFADIDLDDPNFERTPYQEFVAYSRSKTANALYAVGLDRRLKGRGVRATAVHPGVIQTELGRHLSPEVVAQMLSTTPTEGTPALGNRTWKSIPQGAATSVWAGIVASAEAVGAHYCEDCHVAAINDTGDLREGGVRSYALDSTRAEALWTKSEAMVGERFAFP